MDPAPARADRTPYVIALLVTVATVVAYAQVATFDFILFDDPQYVRNNAIVNRGLSWPGVQWAFTATYAANWHPLTWMSHMLDCQLFGLNAGAHHLMSVLLHVTCTLALFFVLLSCTRERWPSAFVAAAFALHPAHVESVTWIAERKDVLSTLCWLVTLGTYAQYARGRGLLWWWASLVALAGGLMSKPMVVTAPVTLLLFDIWPLAKIQLGDLVAPSRLWPVVREKLPHFGLAILAAIVTVVVQNREGAVAPLGDVSLMARLATLPISYASYLVTLVWPAGLAFFYPRHALSPALAVGATVALVAITAVVWRYRTRPYLVVGWSWYLITLLPVSGLVQTGDQLMADRYTYVPFIGIFIMLAWAGRDVVRLGPNASLGISITAAAALAGWTILTFFQIGTWRDSISVARHALSVTRANHVAHYVLGYAMLEGGRLDDAIAEFRAGVADAPGYADLQYSLGKALARRGDNAAAIAPLQQALRLRPDKLSIYYDLGQALASVGDFNGAATAYRSALRFNPTDAALHNELGLALASLHRHDDALAEYRAALALDPRRADALNNIGLTLEAKGQKAEAIASYRAALRIEPTNTFALTNLGAALSDQGQFDEGSRYLEEAIRAGSTAPEVYYLLGAARLGQGRRSDAAAAFERALALRPGWPAAEAKLQEARGQ